MNPVPKVGHTQTISDVDVVVAMRTARQVFSDGILREAGTDQRDLRRRLTSDSVFQIAEFFFLLKCHGIETTQQVREFARLHNEYLTKAINSPEELERLERTRSQVDGAFFSEIGIDKLAENFLRNPPSFDQSDLCRFLVTQQSFENCRRSLKTLRDTGLLEETRIAYGSIVLHSRGNLEQVYQNHIETLRSRLLPQARANNHE
ncbi:MAG: hypothetical protein OXF88_01950 [Rhodobacteraceae bacterium]|nr:hypothetical protein [Paracoccaceae bacterium]MCY4140664.1 hypothetical protein [Paracoccaceae bacterium]